MEVLVYYAKETVKLRIPDSVDATALYPREPEVGGWVEVDAALKNPGDSSSFGDFAGEHESILFIVNDASRPTPTAGVLERVGGRVDLRKCKFIVATGSHRRPTDEELAGIFGRNYAVVRDRIILHDARDEKRLDYYGETPRGTPVYLNKAVRRADAVVNITSVEPHYFAGYTGGRKSFLPGVAGYGSIERNHANALSPDSRLCRLEGNPVHEDLVDALALVGKEVYSINLVLNHRREIVRAFGGDVVESFERAAAESGRNCMTKVEGKFDVVVAVTEPPKDRNLYQTQQAIERGRLALADGGILVVVSECGGGVGPDNYYRLLASSRNPQEILERIREDYVLGYHKVARLLEIRQWSEIYAVTKLPADVVEDCFMTPFSSPQEAVDAALEVKGGGARVLVLSDAILSVPSVG